MNVRHDLPRPLLSKEGDGRPAKAFQLAYPFWKARLMLSQESTNAYRELARHAGQFSEIWVICYTYLIRLV